VAAPTLPRSCQQIRPGTGSTRDCARGTSNFFLRVQDAVNGSIGAPYRDPDTGETIEMVDGNRKILVPSAYIKRVSDTLDAAGLCALYDGEEMYVNDGGGYNEHFDIVTQDGRSWISYNATCNPALPFPPLPSTPPQQDPDCRLAPSRAFFCFKDSSAYDNDVFGALDDLIAEDRARATPMIFDFRDRLAGVPDGWKIINEALYVSETLKKMKARGLCAIFDGDEFSVKRRTNTFSEDFDLIKAEGFSIRLYNATCRDAEF
jgi:hypothetical protein